MKIGIHFGLNQVSPAAYGGWQGFLSGCLNDASAMAATLAVNGFETKGIFDADCTLERLRQELSDAANKLEAGDSLIFSNSGHGGQSSGFMGNKTETLCMFDGQLSDAEFRMLLSKFKEGVNVVIVVDACHSGGLDRDVPCNKPRVAPLFITKNLQTPNVKDVLVSANVVLLAACQPDEVAMDGDMNGAFTGSLLATLKDGMTWRQWFESTGRYMSQNHASQHPTMVELNGEFADQPVSSQA